MEALELTPPAYLRREWYPTLLSTDLALKELEELSKATIVVFPTIAKLWHLTEAEQETLLGADIKDRNPDSLPEDTLARAGFVLGIFSCLHTLYPKAKPVDLVRQPDATYAFKGMSIIDLMSSGLELKGKRAIVVLASGGMYSNGPAKPFDFTEPYLRTVLGSIG